MWGPTSQIACWGRIPNPLESQNVFCELRHFCKMTDLELWESAWELSWGLWECDVILTSHWEIVRIVTSSHSCESISGTLVTFPLECFAETRSRISGICVKVGIGDVPQQARSHCGAPQSLLASNFLRVFYGMEKCACAISFSCVAISSKNCSGQVSSCLIIRLLRKWKTIILPD